MRLYIDDVRPTPDRYDARCYTSAGAINIIKYCSKNGIKISEISLDHDAGDCVQFGGDYIEILKWLEKEKYEGKDYCEDTLFCFHTENPVGRDNMRRIIMKCGWKLSDMSN